MDSKAIDALARLGITLARWERGRQYVNCPQCALNAKHAHNRRARKLAVSIEPDGAVLWFCNNCEWSGGLNDHSRARQEAPRARPRPDLVRAARRSLAAGGDRVSLSAETLAQLLDCSKTTVHGYVRRGIIPRPIRIGDLVRWRWVDVEKAIGCLEAGDHYSHADACSDPYLEGLERGSEEEADDHAPALRPVR